MRVVRKSCEWVLRRSAAVIGAKGSGLKLGAPAARASPASEQVAASTGTV